MKFAQVVFPERFPRSSNFFDYKILPKDQCSCEVGSVVEVPFRASKKIGVIVSVREQSEIPEKKLKNISTVYPKLELITKNQLRIAQWLQKTTASSLGTIFHTMLPSKPKKQTYPNIKRLKLTKTKQHKKFSARAFIFHSLEDLKNFAKKSISEQKTTIIIVPDLTSSKLLFKALSPLTITLFDGSLNATEKFLVWKKIYLGDAKIVIGTRNALLLPFQQVDSIILFDESNITHQRIEQHPDSDTRELAKYIGQEYGAKLFFIGTFLSLETYNDFTKLSPIQIFSRHTYPAIKIIDSSFFIQKKQSPLLPDDLIHFLRKDTTNAFLLYNRKGLYRRIHCTECGWEPHCKNCRSAFISERNARGELECRVCMQKSIAPISCPQCANPQIHFSYPGIEEIHRRLLQVIPSSMISLVSKEKKYTPPLQRIVLGTLYAVPYINWQKMKSVIVLDTDISLDFPDFRSSEWLLGRLQSMYASLQNDQSTFFIITKHPNHPTLQAFKEHIPLQWYANELQERKKLHFPPFSSLIKLSRTDTNKERGEKIAQQTIKELNIFFSRQKIQSLVISIDPIPERSPSGFHFSILVRIQKSKDFFLSALYDLCGSRWHIKMNPLDLFS